MTLRTFSRRSLARAAVGAVALAGAHAAMAVPTWCANVSANTCAVAQRIGTGLNVDGPIASDDDHPAGRLTRDQIADICRRFQSVRLPLRFSDQDGNPLPKRIAAAKALADQFVSCGAVVIVDNHLGEPGADQHFQAIWSQVAQAFKGDSPNIVLELLNEPSERIKAERWNQAAAAALKQIRAAGNQNTVLMGTVNYNGVWTLGQLRVPADRDVIVGVHIYEPMSFTHQGAEWMRQAMPAGVTCCDAAESVKIQKMIGRARQWSNDAGVPIVVGEFGVMRKAPAQQRVDYVRAFAAAARQAQVPLLYWEYDKGFGLYDAKAGQWDQSMLDALGGKGPPAPVASPGA